MSSDFSSLRTKLDGLSANKTRLLELMLQGEQRTPRLIPRMRREPGSSLRARASSAQQRLWFLDQLEGSSLAYHIPLTLEVLGHLDHATLRSALEALVDRHETLRTTFVKADGQVYQEIAPAASIVLETEDLRTTADPQQELLRRSREQLITPFDLSVGPLLRVRLLQLGAEEHELLITMHHIISDGWSFEILVRELWTLYAAYRREQPPQLPELPIQYADFAEWQLDRAQREDSRQQLLHWKEHLRGAPDLLDLPTDRPRPAAQSYRGASVQVSLGHALTAGLRQLARRYNMTVAMVLHAAWSVLLARLSGQDDIVVGIPVANRRRPELEGLIGFFVNTLAVRLQMSDDPLVTELLQRTRDVLLAAYAHQDTPFEQVVEALQPARSLSHSPIFQTMFSLRSGSAALDQTSALTLREREVPLHAAQFDLNLSLQETNDSITGKLAYATDLFDLQTAERWVGHFLTLAHAMVESPDARVSALRILGDADRRIVVEQFNATRQLYDENSLLHELIEQQVRRTPDAAAIEYENDVLTYADLNRRANQLAHCLRKRGVGPDCLVGICVERSIEMVVGLLGILKAGGAYVPLDPAYPLDRLAYMLADAAPSVLLTQAKLLTRLPRSTATVLALDKEWPAIAQHPADNPDTRGGGLAPHNLAYVIYTSGSTGQPKGAMNDHRGICNRLLWMQQQYGLGSHDRVLQKTPFSFDVSVWEFFWTLQSGARLIIARPDGHKDPGYLRELIERSGVTTLHFVPSMLQAFLHEFSPGSCPCIRRIVCSGEELPVSLQDKCLDYLPQVQLSNLYGPTEAAVDVTFWECRRGQQLSTRVPIGQPVANTQIHILDRHLQPAPIGVAGEIHIGGVQVGRGYLNRPELTAQRFIPDPFCDDPRARLYKTGDLGRRRVDGEIEYLGRNDFQVKIRGFRIELGEIESWLARHELVKEAVVVTHQEQSGDKQLVAYVVPKDTQAAPTADALRECLKAVLPEHMIPGAFVLLEQLPLSPNGKLDRRALPTPDRNAYASRRYEPPQGELEEILAGVWQALLPVPCIGRQDNFFELGGHSLLLVQMLERLRRRGLAADVRRVYESTTLAELARSLGNAGIPLSRVPENRIPAGSAAITPEMLPLVKLDPEHIERIAREVPHGASNIQDIYPLTPLQEGILFHHLFSERGGDTYVVPTLLEIADRARLDELVAALQRVVDRHDVLRTAVLWEQLPSPVQVVCRRADLPIEEVVLSLEHDALTQVMDWLQPEQQHLDLRHAPLLRLRVAADPSSGRWYALLQIHHIVGDNTSRSIVVAEVSAQLEGRAQQLPVPVPYRNHVAQALTYAGTHDAEAFFKEKLGDVDEPTVPFGLGDIHGHRLEIHESRTAVATALAQRVRAQARRFAVSAATLFHAAWSLVVAHTSGRDDVVFGTVLLGRMQGDAGAQRIFGMFINTLPVRVRLHGLSAKALVEQMQRELVDVLMHEQASLALAQRCSAVPGAAPLFSALLNYRHSIAGQEADWSDVPGLRVLARRERTNYPLVVSIDDNGAGFSISAQTDPRIDSARVISQVESAIESLVEALEVQPELPALSLSVLSQDERRMLLQAFNATSAPYPRDKLIHELFEEQASRAPDFIAALYEQQVLTYAELNAQANRLAHYIRARGVKSHEYVVVHMSRSLQMVIAQIAVLKCGGVYVPLDPQLPIERRAFIVRDCGARLILADGDAADEPPLSSATWVDCRTASSATLSDDDLGVPLSPSDPAYVMYTSGSTGAPKGVVVPHHAVNHLAINNGFVDIQASDCVAHHSNPAFDASTLEIWGALLNGARVLIVPQAVVLEPASFAELLERHGASVMYMSVGLFNQYTDALAHVFGRLRYLMIGGEVLDPNAIRKVRKRCPPQFLLNVYGPTECTTISTSYRIEHIEEDATSVPIGRPVANARIYFLDARLQPVPIGAVGELYIGGAGVACGYLNRPELTAERFITDPFGANPDARLYRTGDLGRWRADGVIEFLGRNDQQVKIRGFRIELGEIEAVLVQHPCVREVVVQVCEDSPGAKRLVAYVTASVGSAAPAIDDLRGYARSRLPEYMLPSAFVVLDNLPLTTTGKVDRRALKPPAGDAYGTTVDEAPRGEIETAIADIYADLLRVERLGRTANFFDLGGHSLLAVQAVVRINAALGASLRVTDLYRRPTAAELAEHIQTGDSAEQWLDLAREATLDSDIVPTAGATAVHARAVLLTGATGFVGRFLLAELLARGATVYCVVRAPTPMAAMERLRTTLSVWDLWRDEFAERLVAVPGDLRRPRLGIAAQTYQQLTQEVESIYHCGTSMNHLETYTMAKAANVQSAREVLRLAVAGRPKLVNYISTLGVFSYATSEAPRTVHESTSIEQERHSTASGYVASKWVAEKIFMTAEERGVACNIFRLGLVWADSREGRYDELQHVYRLLKSCLLSGRGIHDFRHEMAPTPVDYVARAVVHLASCHFEGGGVFHICAPQASAQPGWFERSNSIANTSLTLMPYYDWILEVKQLHEQGCSLPVVPLIEFAFSLDRSAFEAQQRRRARIIHFDATRTHRELEQAGLVAPVLDDDLLRVCLDGMIRRDVQLRALRETDGVRAFGTQ